MAVRRTESGTRGTERRTYRTITRLRSWPAMVALLLALAVVATACGGGGDDDRDTQDSAGGASALGFPSEESADVKFDDGLFAAVAPSAANAGESFGGGDFANIDLLGRQIIRSASVALEVDSVAGSFDEVEAIALTAGGFVGSSSFFGHDEERSAQLTLRIPAGAFGEVMTKLRALAVEVTSISTSAQDVTEEFTDIEAQLSNLRAVEVRYLELLGEARGISEILQVQDRIDGVRLQIDRLEGRMRVLEDLTDLATISVSLSPVPAVVATSGGSGPLAAAGEAWQASLNSLEAVATVLLVAVVYSWWLLPLALVLGFIALRMRRRITFARDDRGEIA